MFKYSVSLIFGVKKSNFSYSFLGNKKVVYVIPTIHIKISISAHRNSVLPYPCQQPVKNFRNLFLSFSEFQSIKKLDFWLPQNRNTSLMIVANISEKLSLDYKIFLGFSFLTLLNIMYIVISFKLKIGFLSFPNDLLWS